MTTKKYFKRYKKKYPWRIFFSRIKSRCKQKDHAYYKRGIRNFLSKEDLKYLWFRDKAYLMKRPSIDRRNSKGNYTLGNCRFIELKENCKQGGINKWKKYNKGKWATKHSKCIKCGTTKRKHMGRGLCIRCYSYKYWKEIARGKYVKLKLKPHSPICSVEGCNNKYLAKGLCNLHYKRKKYGKRKFG